MTAKLTPAQIAVLRELAKPGNFAMRYGEHGSKKWDAAGDAYPVPIRTQPLYALVKIGYAKHRDKGHSTDIITVTPEGRAFLAALDKEPKE